MLRSFTAMGSALVLSLAAVHAQITSDSAATNVPVAESPELRAYKAKFYQAVGSRWYQLIGPQMPLIGVGRVKVQYTIKPDGTVTTKVLDNGNGAMQILLIISVKSIQETSPLLPFTDTLRKEVGDSYTDSFTFSVSDDKAPAMK